MMRAPKKKRLKSKPKRPMSFAKWLKQARRKDVEDLLGSLDRNSALDEFEDPDSKPVKKELRHDRLPHTLNDIKLVDHASGLEALYTSAYVEHRRGKSSTIFMTPDDPMHRRLKLMRLLSTVWLISHEQLHATIFFLEGMKASVALDKLVVEDGDYLGSFSGDPADPMPLTYDKAMLEMQNADAVFDDKQPFPISRLKVGDKMQAHEPVWMLISGVVDLVRLLKYESAEMPPFVMSHDAMYYWYLAMTLV
jgi:hypothetical protein